MSSRSEMILIIGALTLVTSLLVTRALESWARRRGLLAPVTERGAHHAPVPRLGGTAIVAATMLGIGLMAPRNGLTAVVLGVGLLVYALGLIDDVRGLGPGTKYLVQLFASGLVAAAVAPVLLIDLPGSTAIVEGLPAAVVVAVLLTGFMNAFNFMDGADGLLGSIVVASLPAMTLIHPAAPPFAIPLGCACVGFLFWNLRPARIFMGDGGSLFIGYLWAAIMLLVVPSVGLVTISLTIAPVVVDTSATLLSRALAAEPIWKPHRRHLYQVLQQRGWTSRRISGAYGLATFGAGASAVTYATSGDAGAKLGIIGGWLIIWVIALILVTKASPSTRAAPT